MTSQVDQKDLESGVKLPSRAAKFPLPITPRGTSDF